MDAYLPIRPSTQHRPSITREQNYPITRDRQQPPLTGYPLPPHVREAHATGPQTPTTQAGRHLTGRQTPYWQTLRQATPLALPARVLGPSHKASCRRTESESDAAMAFPRGNPEEGPRRECPPPLFPSTENKRGDIVGCGRWKENGNGKKHSYPDPNGWRPAGVW